MDDLSRAKYEIEAFLTTGQRWRCRRDGLLVGDVTTTALALSIEFGKLIFSLWGDDFSECWKIVEYEIRGERLRLHLQRALDRAETILELCPPTSEGELSEAYRQRRRTYEAIISQRVAEAFNAGIERVVTERDAHRHLSGIYTRMVLRRGAERIAAIAVNPHESQRHIDGALTAGLIWWEYLRQQSRTESVMPLFLFVPQGRSLTIARRLTVLRPPAPLRLHLYEVEPRSAEIIPIRPFDQGELFDPAAERLPHAAAALRPHAERDRLLALAPHLLRLYRRPGSRVESVRLRGLEVARVSGRRITFGIGGRKRPLGHDWTEIEAFIAEVARIRQPESDEKFHPFYRLQAERWLEEMIRDDVRRLDPRLDTRLIYPQIPAHRDDDYGMVDLLGITEEGQLAIIELKVEEDSELPMQGLDYWLKVEWHRRRGDFHRRGYFPGRDIADRPALVLLVAPVFRFHPTFDLVARWIDASVPVYKIGIAEEWRRGVKVVHRERANGVAGHHHRG